MPRSRKILVIAVVIVVIGAIVYGFMPKPVDVETSVVSTGPMKVTVDEEGKTRVADRYVLSAPVAGYMRRTALDVGDMVSRGQAVVVLEPARSEVLDPRSRATAEASVAAAEADLEAARDGVVARSAEADLATAELVRARALVEKGHISKSALDRAESASRQAVANLSAASAQVKTAEAALKRARAALGYSPADGVVPSDKAVAVRSPVSGRVLKVHRESEGAVVPGMPLVDIGDTSTLEVWSEVLSTDAVNIKPGASVLFERWGGQGSLEGRVRVVEPAAFTKVSSLGVEEQRVIVVSDLTSAPSAWQSLGDGFRVEARFIVWKTDNAVKVPTSAVFRSGVDNAVFVVEGARAKERRVKTGHMNGVEAEVLEGLKAGDQVIIHPDDALRDNARVRAR